MKKVLLSDNWRLLPFDFADLPENIDFPTRGIAAEIPGTVHTDLLAAGLIADPFYSDNERRLQWIHEIDWSYETVFDLPPDFEPAQACHLIFEGLDTIAEIRLNGRQLGRTENMFRRFEYPVDSLLKKNENLLQITFFSPTVYGRAKEAVHGKLEVPHASERVYVRKAQYSFGWDWGPRYPAMGIWRPVYLLQAAGPRIKNFRFHTASLTGRAAEVMVEMEFRGKMPAAGKLRLTLSGDRTVYSRELPPERPGPLQHTFTVPEPKLWWPAGYGEAYLYTLKLEILDEENKIRDSLEKRVGIRTVTLETRDKGKNVFRFVVNGRDIFAKGANWIPSDAFLPRMSPSTYRTLLEMARNANMNFIRVWGGGIYEPELFYELCDELGLLIWQDFMFACGAYPEDADFLENIGAEIRENVNRLQHHPSIALWCGNNENEWIWFREFHQLPKTMPGFKIYHRQIPVILQRLDPLRPYWPSTPFGDETDPNAELSGNRHQWDIWSRWADYTEVSADRSLFVTEFGFQAPANRSTLETVIPLTERTVQGEIFEFHNKQVEGNERLFRFLAGHLPVNTGWQEFIYLTQLNQGLALKACLEHWRKRAPAAAGSIIWQLNDCWPVSSWSLIDSGLRPKLSWYFVKQAFEPRLICFEKSAETLRIIVLNQLPEEFAGNVKLQYWRERSGDLLAEKEFPVHLKAGEPGTEIPVPLESRLAGIRPVITGSLYSGAADLLSRNVHLEGRWKHYRLWLPGIRMEEKSAGEDWHLRLTSRKPAFFVDFEGAGERFSDRGFILLPGEEKLVTVRREGGEAGDREDIQMTSLNRFLHS